MADPDLQLRGEGRGAFEGLTMNVEFCEDNSTLSARGVFFKSIDNRGFAALKKNPLAPRVRFQQCTEYAPFPKK